MRRLVAALVVACALWAQPAAAAVAVVTSLQFPWPGGSDSSTTTSSLDTSGANLVLLLVAWNEPFGGALNTPSDSKGNTWTSATSASVNGQNKVQLWYAKNATTGSGHTFTATHTSYGRMRLYVVALSGADTTAPIAAASANALDSYPSATFTHTSLSPSGSPFYVAQLWMESLNAALTGLSIDSSFSINGSWTQQGAFATLSGSGTQGPTWTFTPSNAWPRIFATFAAITPSGGGGGGGGASVCNNALTLLGVGCGGD